VLEEIDAMDTRWMLPLNLTELPVTIGCTSSTPRRWTGAARGVEDLVALGLMAHDGVLRWFKSSHRAATVPLDVTLHPPDAVEGGYVVLDVGGSVDNALSRGGRSISVLPCQAITGRPLFLATVEGDPRIELGILLLAFRDVKFGRNHLWRIWPELAQGVPEPFATILVRGRSGTA
jgi:hypothetical protein